MMEMLDSNSEEDVDCEVVMGECGLLFLGEWRRATMALICTLHCNEYG
jgi:hypothetical protein